MRHAPCTMLSASPFRIPTFDFYPLSPTLSFEPFFPITLCAMPYALCLIHPPFRCFFIFFLHSTFRIPNSPFRPPHPLLFQYFSSTFWRLFPRLRLHMVSPITLTHTSCSPEPIQLVLTLNHSRKSGIFFILWWGIEMELRFQRLHGERATTLAVSKIMQAVSQKVKNVAEFPLNLFL